MMTVTVTEAETIRTECPECKQGSSCPRAIYDGPGGNGFDARLEATEQAVQAHNARHHGAGPDAGVQPQLFY